MNKPKQTQQEKKQACHGKYKDGGVWWLDTCPHFEVFGARSHPTPQTAESEEIEKDLPITGGEEWEKRFKTDWGCEEVPDSEIFFPTISEMKEYIRNLLSTHEKAIREELICTFECRFCEHRKV